MSYDKIPDELKQLNQWILWREEIVDEKPTKVPYRSVDGRHASVNNPLDWCSFDNAVNSVSRINASGIGLVTTRSDRFCFVDLDNPNGDIKITERQNEIFRTLDSYAEISPSGNGLHIICEAVLPELGRRRNKIEIYDNLRFFTFTGNVYHNAPISNRQVEIEAIYATLANPNIILSDTNGLEHETFTDELVLEKCNNGETRELFKSLWSGKWNDRYQSQSEADFAIVNLISFYSKNAAQTKRLFLSSGLGQRSKSKRTKYVDGMVQRSFDRMPKQITIKPNGLNGHAWFHAGDYEPWYPKQRSDQIAPIETAAWQAPEPSPAPASSLTAPTLPAEVLAPSGATKTRRRKGYQFSPPVPPMAIPGLVGQLVDQCWRQASHQLAETAIASALSTMSLLCGRSYRHGSIGLSLYIMLLAQTSTGKDFAYQANDLRFNKMIEQYKKLLPPLSQVGKLRAEQLERMIRRDIGSSQGLAQAFTDAPSLLFQLDEYVENLRLMSMPNPPPGVAQIKTALLQLFNMSGPGRVYRAPVYSKRNTNLPVLKDILSASLTILATGTPEQFYDELSNHLLTSGFIPRFVILDYNGGIPEKNENPCYDIDPQLIANMRYLFDRAESLAPTLVGTIEEFLDVQPDEATGIFLEEVDQWCLHQANTANQNGSNLAGVWSRAKDNVRKIASLIAVGVNPHMPTITGDHVQIAIDIVTPSINKIARKISGGELGQGDARCEAEIKRVILNMIEKGYYGLKSWSNLKKELIDNNIFQVSILRNMCSKMQPFKTHKLGYAKAFNDSLSNMIKYGAFTAFDQNGIACIMIGRDFYNGSD